MGVPIFSIWVLFTVFYAAAIYCRRRAADHKRLMLLASAAALSAATFRILVRIFGFEPWVAIVGTLAPNLFLLVAMLHDYRSVGKVHRMYLWGARATFGLVGGTFLVIMSPGGEVLKQGIARVGRLLRPLYFALVFAAATLLAGFGSSPDAEGARERADAVTSAEVMVARIWSRPPQLLQTRGLA